MFARTASRSPITFGLLAAALRIAVAEDLVSDAVVLGSLFAVGRPLTVDYHKPRRRGKSTVRVACTPGKFRYYGSTVEVRECSGPAL